jgi:hypothetical protein
VSTDGFWQEDSPVAKVTQPGDLLRVEGQADGSHAYPKAVLAIIRTETDSDIGEDDSCEFAAKGHYSHERLIHVLRAKNLENRAGLLGYRSSQNTAILDVAQ